jgi:hypothetical protein
VSVSFYLEKSSEIPRINTTTIIIPIFNFVS